MAQTKAGALKTRQHHYERYGLDYYRDIGAIGGRNGTTGGFYANRELAREAGRIGGSISRRGVKLTDREKRRIRKDFQDNYDNLRRIAEEARRQRKMAKAGMLG